MAQTFFFYDLETSGLDPKRDRIMQFAGIRTTLDLEPIGEPMNFYVKLSPEVIPAPMATLTTGITPQTANRLGISEREAMSLILSQAFVPDTIAIGFNNVEFDDEMMRYSLYRNFMDPYRWTWADGRSRWDLLRAIRLVRALRPSGISWPVDEDGGPVNRLEQLTTENDLPHLRAHDALSDVEATIAIARLFKAKQPQMFTYLLHHRDKDSLAQIVSLSKPVPFVYASGMFGRTYDFTTVCLPVGEGLNRKIVVYDLRHDPTPLLNLSVDELKARCFATRADLERQGLERLPVKEIALNKAPAVAPWSTWTPEVAARLNLDDATVRRHWAVLQGSSLPQKLTQVYTAKRDFPAAQDVDGALYDGFVGDGDKAAMDKIANASVAQLSSLNPAFRDKRLPELLLRYKGRNAPQCLSETEAVMWQAFVAKRRDEDKPTFELELAQARSAATKDEQPLLDELEAWANQAPVVSAPQA